MRKHIFGFALFILIFASFALVYAFFYAPSIPTNEAVKPPITQMEMRTEKPYSCQFKRNKLSYKVISSEFDIENNELTSKIKIFWNGYGEPPKRIFANVNFYTNNGIVFKQLEPMSFTKVFENRTEATLIVQKKFYELDRKINERENLYFDLNFSEYYPDEVESADRDDDFSKASQVLLIHGTKQKF